MCRSMSAPWWRDSNQTASGKPGAVQTVKTKGCLSRKTALAMAFKLILSARRKWRKLDGSNQLAELVEGVPFKDGIKITKHAA